jgi:hypothetical protein
MSIQGWIFLAVVGFLIALYFYRKYAARPQHDNQAPAAADMQLRQSEDDGPIPNAHETVEADAVPALKEAPATEDTMTSPPSEPTPPETTGGPPDSR